MSTWPFSDEYLATLQSQTDKKFAHLITHFHLFPRFAFDHTSDPEVLHIR